MGFKSSLYQVYRKVHDSEKWETSPIFKAIRPLAWLSIWILYKLVWLKRLTFKFLKKLRPVRRLRHLKSKLNRQQINLHYARHAASVGDWRDAKSRYEKVLERTASKPRRSEIVNECRLNISAIDRLLDVAGYKSQIDAYNAAKQKVQPKIVVYTAVSGGYDLLKLPAALNPRFDYVFFTDKPTPDSGIFQIRPLPYFHEDPTRQARYVKTHPHQLLKEYDVAVWVDANIMIMDDISTLVDGFIASKRPVGAVRHPLRSTVYQEAKACVFYSKEDEDALKEQVKHLKSLGYKNNDLIESNIMMFDLKSKTIPGFFATWWSEIDTYTRRDQMSLNYSLDKNKLKWHRLMDRPADARDHPLFTLVPHHIKQPSISALEAALGAKKSRLYPTTSFSKVRAEVIAAQAKRRIDIVYCVHNALDDIKECLASVKYHRKSQHVNLIIVDDGSDTPTADYLKVFCDKHQDWVKLVRNDQAVGYTKAANIGLRTSTGELAILLNSDTVVTAGWTEKMADAVFSTASAGIVGPLSSAASTQSIPNYKSENKQTATNELPDGLGVDDMNAYCEKWAKAGVYPLVPLVHGFCFGMTREAIKKVGLFDEKSFPRGYGEENDLCFRAIDAGFNLVLATNTYIYHKKSKSYPSEERIKLMERGNQTLRDLHGRRRIWRAVVTMQKNPELVKVRAKAQKLYR